MAFPRVHLHRHSTAYYYLNQMLCYDLTSEIFRDGGGLVLINNAGDVIADHPFNTAVPCEFKNDVYGEEYPNSANTLQHLNLFSDLKLDLRLALYCL